MNGIMNKSTVMAAGCLLIGLLSFCTKESGQVSTSPSQMRTVSSDVHYHPENHANPYDQAGYIHNRALAFIQQQTATLKNPTISDIRRAMVKFDEHHLDTIHAIPGCTDAVKAGISNRFAELIEQSPYTEKTKEYISGLFRLVNNAKTADLLAVKPAIVSLEADILSDAALTKADLEVLLTCTSIARYSARYWTDSPDSEPVQPERRLIRWIITVSADIIGGYIGGLDCAIENSSVAGFYAGWL